MPGGGQLQGGGDRAGGTARSDSPLCTMVGASSEAVGIAARETGCGVAGGIVFREAQPVGSADRQSKNRIEPDGRPGRRRDTVFQYRNAHEAQPRRIAGLAESNEAPLQEREGAGELG